MYFGVVCFEAQGRLPCHNFLVTREGAATSVSALMWYGGPSTYISPLASHLPVASCAFLDSWLPFFLHICVSRHTYVIYIYIYVIYHIRINICASSSSCSLRGCSRGPPLPSASGAPGQGVGAGRRGDPESRRSQQLHIMPPGVFPGVTISFSRQRFSIRHRTAGALGLPCAVIV